MSVSGLTAATTSFRVELKAVRYVDELLYVYFQKAYTLKDVDCQIECMHA